VGETSWSTWGSSDTENPRIVDQPGSWPKYLSLGRAWAVTRFNHPSFWLTSFLVNAARDLRFSTTLNCDMRNVGSPSLPIIWNIGSLVAGEAKYCFVRIRAVTGAPSGTFLFGQIIDDVVGNFDPNNSNNEAAIRVNYRGIDYLADFQFTATKNFSTLPPLSRGIVSVTAKNLGPEAVPLAAARLQGYSIGPNDTDAFFLATTAQPDPNCFLFQSADVCGPFGDCDVVPDLYFGAMAPGESRTCVFAIYATRFAQGSRRFKIYGAGDGLDSNQQNNDASFALIFTNTQFIPLGGNRWLAALLLITGMVFLRTRHS
jgi:hypothetical protein